MNRDLDRLCRSVLPPGFDEQRRQLPRIQAFLDENLPEPIRHKVTLLSVTADEIVMAASTPTVTSYLRLHANLIQQQLRETFSLEQGLRFRTVPDALLRGRDQPDVPTPEPVGDAAVAAIERNANSIEDETLRTALLELADSLKQTDDDNAGH